MDRRSVLKSGAALSAATLLPGIAASAPSDASGIAIERFVFDERFAEAVAHGRKIRALGTPVSSVSGDLTALWYHDLNLRWKERPMTIGGLTAEDALFVLGTLAPDYRMRVLHKADLGRIQTASGAPAGKLPLYSWIIGPAEFT